jgi:hypothetical protein
MVVAVETGDQIGPILAELLGSTPLDAPVADALLGELPEHSLSLREVAAVLTQQAVYHARTAGDEPETARLLNNLSVRLADLGQREEAAHEEASAFMRLFDHSGDELLNTS